jgi:hypothetical protein
VTEVSAATVPPNAYHEKAGEVVDEIGNRTKQCRRKSFILFVYAHEQAQLGIEQLLAT